MTHLAISPSTAFVDPNEEDVQQINGNPPEVETTTLAESNPPGAGLSPLHYDILEALRALKATDDEKRVTGTDVAKKVGGDTSEQSVKSPLADLKRRGLVDSKIGRNGGSWLTLKGLAPINRLRPKQ